jgi:hypothetical protein
MGEWAQNLSAPRDARTAMVDETSGLRLSKGRDEGAMQWIARHFPRSPRRLLRRKPG